MSESRGNGKGNDFCSLEYLLVNLGRNQAAADRLIHIFIETSPALCQRLENAANQGDLPALRDVLHDIRSSCVLFFRELAAWIRRVTLSNWCANIFSNHEWALLLLIGCQCQHR